MVHVQAWTCNNRDVTHAHRGGQALRELRTDFDGPFRPSHGRPFVILCCNPGVDVRTFIAEFFHEDHTSKNLSDPQLIILMDCMPDNELRCVPAVQTMCLCIYTCKRTFIQVHIPVRTQ